MKLNNILVAGLFVLGLGFTSCDNQDDATYTPADATDVSGCYFTADEEGIAHDMGAKSTGFTVHAYRVEASEAKSYELKVEGEDLTPFTYPSSINFAAGEISTSFDVTFDANTIEVGKKYEFTFILGDGSDTPYYLQTLHQSAAYNPWVAVIGAHGEKYATYTDGFVDTWFTVEPVPYQVPLEQNAALPGIYRLVNPYGEYYPYNSPGDYSKEDHYMYINATDPDKVFLCFPDGEPNHGSTMYTFETGMDWDKEQYGQFIFTGLYNLRMAQGNAEAALPNAGKLENGVITFPERSLLGRMDIFTAAGNWSYCNTKGNFKLVFPGVKEGVASAWEGVGTCQFQDAWIYPLFGVDTPQTWTVEVEKSTTENGLFRLVNPYKAGVMADGEDYDGDKYIEFNISDPNFAYIEPQLCGFIDSQDGEIAISNVAGYYVSLNNPNITPELVTSNGLNDVYNAKTYTLTVAEGHATFQLPLSSDPETVEAVYSPKIKIPGLITLSAEATAAAKQSIALNMDYYKGFEKAVAKTAVNFDMRAKNHRSALKGRKLHMSSVKL